MEDCIFCRIIKGEIPCKKVYEDDVVLCFEDINPVAPIHVILIPKEHIKNINELNEGNIDILSHMVKAIPQIAKKLNIYESGYRVVNNCGEDGGQEVQHIHFHIIGGRKLVWPPG